MIWFLAGLVIGAGICFFAQAAATGRVKVRWYQWLLGLGAAALYVLAIQNYLGFQAELEPGIAGLMLVLMGVPAVVLTALIWLIPVVADVIGKGKSGTPMAKAG